MLKRFHIGYIDMVQESSNESHVLAQHEQSDRIHRLKLPSLHIPELQPQGANDSTRATRTLKPICS